ncbi:hypothetical protein GCM10009533_18270 [Saccharopolyspora spinosporotrichia]|uniref:Uncharacterized protein n=1 Tax=Saccharopolyspora erythraea TaxID=1836 RepID=A0ABN1CJH6_SACER
MRLKAAMGPVCRFGGGSAGLPEHRQPPQVSGRLDRRVSQGSPQVRARWSGEGAVGRPRLVSEGERRVPGARVRESAASVVAVP